MGNSDEIDRRRARWFTWTVATPGQPVELPEEPGEDSAARESPAGETRAGGSEPTGETRATAKSTAREQSDEAKAFWAHARERSGELALAIERTWAMESSLGQVRATESLLLELHALGVGSAALGNHPRESVRIARLAVRHHARLSDETRKVAGGAMLWLDYEHPETVDLLAELVTTGVEGMSLGLWMRCAMPESGFARRHPTASARLAAILDEATDPAVRLTALNWLSQLAGPSAVPALRRALRSTHFAIRALAVSILADLPPPSATEEDVRFLLDDLVDHPPPDAWNRSRHEEVATMSWALDQLVTRLHPPLGQWPLLRIAAGNCPGFYGVRTRFDDEWALCALAAGYPEAALDDIDRALGSSGVEVRLRGVRAALRLPSPLAEPRLLRAAVDGAKAVAECARDGWLARFHTSCPTDELAGVEVALLEGPPSETLLNRLTVLRGSNDPARHAIVRLLLRSPADRETLVLLLFALGDSDLWKRSSTPPGLPCDRAAWAKRILRRFGSLGVAGLCALGERFPDGQSSWADVVNECLRNRLVRRRDWPVVQSMAARGVLAGRTHLDVLSILARLGAPRACHALLWSLVLDPDEYELAREYAAEALREAGPDADVDARVVTEMEAALTNANFEVLRHCATIGVGRRVAGARCLARRALVEVTDRDARYALAVCARELDLGGPFCPPWAGRYRHRRSTAGVESAPAARRRARAEAWILAGLAHPERLLFSVAAFLAGLDPSEPIEKALHAALDLGLAGGWAAADAATSLLLLRNGHPLARDRRLKGILERADPVAAVELVDRLHSHRTDDSLIRPYLIRFLTSPDRRITRHLETFVQCLHRPEDTDLVREIFPQIVDENLRLTIEYSMTVDLASPWEDEG